MAENLVDRLQAPSPSDSLCVGLPIPVPAIAWLVPTPLAKVLWNAPRQVDVIELGAGDGGTERLDQREDVGAGLHRGAVQRDR